MIGYLEGKLLQRDAERILLLSNQVGYEILLPATVMESMAEKNPGDDISLYIFYHQTERQPKPVLIGFPTELEKEFFQLFISVEDIGPIKAVKALNRPVRQIAQAIESKDLALLKTLKGIGARTAQKIIATLQGKTDKFLLDAHPAPAPWVSTDEMARQVLNVLVLQLGHKSAEARRMVQEALNRNRGISSAEDLFEEIYRGDNLK